MEVVHDAGRGRGYSEAGARGEGKGERGRAFVAPYELDCWADMAGSSQQQRAAMAHGEGVVTFRLPSAASVRASMDRLNELLNEAIALQRPWQELADFHRFALPPSLPDAGSRVKCNLIYFRGNYTLALLAVMFASLLFHPFPVFFLGVIAALWLYIFRTDPVVALGHSVTGNTRVLALGGVTVLLVFGLSLVGSVILVGFVTGAMAVLAHSAIRVSDDLVLDDQEAAGFLSWLSAGGVAPFSR